MAPTVRSILCVGSTGDVQTTGSPSLHLHHGTGPWLASCGKTVATCGAKGSSKTVWQVFALRENLTEESEEVLVVAVGAVVAGEASVEVAAIEEAADGPSCAVLGTADRNGNLGGQTENVGDVIAENLPDG